MRDFYEELVAEMARDPQSAHTLAAGFHSEIRGEIQHLQTQLELVTQTFNYLERRVRAGASMYQVITPDGPSPAPSYSPVAPPVTPAEIGAPAPLETRDVRKVDRSKVILVAARELVAEGRVEITTHMVLARLTGQGLNLGVKRPRAVIGSVLANSPDLEKSDTNMFKFVGEK